MIDQETLTTYYSKEDIVRDINIKLAGENLRYDQLQLYIDATIDDINQVLNATYPTTKEMEDVAHAIDNLSDADDNVYHDYKAWNGLLSEDTEDPVCYLTLFPRQVVRRVIILGAALKWLTADEEGIATAPTYEQDYQKELFYLQRDYSNKVPEQYQASEQGYVYDSFVNRGIAFYDGINGRRTSNTPFIHRR